MTASVARAALFALGITAVALPLSVQAQCCGVPVRPSCQTVFMPQEVTRYRLQQETVMQPEQVTTYRPVWETSVQRRTYRVAKPVTETNYREERYAVLRPVTSVEEREQVCNVVEYVNETQTREIRQTVMKPVWVQQVQRQQYTVRRPVQRTVMQNQQHTEYRQVTTYRTQYVDQGQYVCQQQVVPGASRNRLRWLAGRPTIDPVTGTPSYQRGGLYWVPQAGAGRVETQRVWQPNVVAQQIPVTQNVPQVVNRQIPVQVTEYVNEVQTREIPYNVCQWQQEVQVQHVPYTVQRPVTRQVVNKYQVQVCNWQRQEMVRRVPVTTCRVEYEERVQEVPVQTCKWVAETSTVMRPHCTQKWVPYTCTRLVPRTVMTASPCAGCSVASAATSYYAPQAMTQVPAQRPTTTLKPVTPPAAPAENGPQTQESPRAADADSVLKDGPDLNAPAADSDAATDEPANNRPQLQVVPPYAGDPTA